MIKTGGRKKGTPNKGSAPCSEKAHELGIEPFTVLLLFAAGDWQKLGYAAPIDPAIRCKAAAEACHYLYPKRKAIEHPTDNKIRVIISDYCTS